MFIFLKDDDHLDGCAFFLSKLSICCPDLLLDTSKDDDSSDGLGILNDDEHPAACWFFFSMLLICCTNLFFVR